jgi:hypothetical protein
LGNAPEMKTRSSAFVIILLIGGLALAGTLHLGTVSAATNVSGIISSNATWTKTNSPYSLTGNVLVSNGVTLTIEAGATVKLNSYFIMVNGTLRARGSSADKIQFNGGQIQFTIYGTSWNEATGSGSIIENANLGTTSLSIDSVSPKIDGNSLSEISAGGSAIISNNNIADGITLSESPTISHNTIGGEVSVSSNTVSPLITYNQISGRIYVAYSAQSPVITYNTVTGGIEVNKEARSPQISYNTISGGMTIGGDSATVSFNTITGGISASASTITFLNNTIAGSAVGIDFVPASIASSTNATIVNNKIVASETGIRVPGSFTEFIYGYYTDAYISGNSITGCANAGIQVGGATYGVNDYPRPDIVTIENNLLANNNIGVNTSGTSRIEGNTISNNNYGIIGGDPIRNNIIANNKYGIMGGSTVEGNVIINNEVGLVGGIQITKNTIAKNTLGIKSGFSTLNYNNIFDNQMNVNFTSSNNADATYNWWGTTDTEKISQSIYDYKNDFTLGKVNFEPFLTSPNPDAPAIPATLPTSIPTPSPGESPSTPTPPPTSSPSPTSTPNQQPTLTPEQVTLIVGAVIVAVVVGAAAGLLVYLIKKK